MIDLLAFGFFLLGFALGMVVAWVIAAIHYGRHLDANEKDIRRETKRAYDLQNLVMDERRIREHAGSRQS